MSVAERQRGCRHVARPNSLPQSVEHAIDA
jgi:hypothetical protein